MNPLCILDAIVHHVRFHINTSILRRRAISSSVRVPALDPESQLSLPTSSNEPVVFTGADLKYLQLYGPSLIEGIARVTSRLRVHIHIMLLAGEDCDAETRALRALLPEDRLTFSLETCETPPDNWHLNSQFYQVRRFARLAEFVSLNKVDVLALDIDTVLLRSPEFVQDEWPNHDLLLQVNLGPLRPTPFSCACVWLRPTERVRRILRQASDKMQQHARTGFFVDHLDERCFANEVYQIPDMEIAALPDDFCSTAPETAYIFEGVGDEKSRISTIANASVADAPSCRAINSFRQACCVGHLRQIHFRKAWNRSSFSILWRRILE